MPFNRFFSMRIQVGSYLHPNNSIYEEDKHNQQCYIWQCLKRFDEGPQEIPNRFTFAQKFHKTLETKIKRQQWWMDQIVFKTEGIIYIKIYASSILKISYRIARKRRRKPMLAPPPSLNSVIPMSTKEPTTMTKSNLFHESRKYS